MQQRARVVGGRDRLVQSAQDQVARGERAAVDRLRSPARAIEEKVGEVRRPGARDRLDVGRADGVGVVPADARGGGGAIPGVDGVADGEGRRGRIARRVATDPDEAGVEGGEGAAVDRLQLPAGEGPFGGDDELQWHDDGAAGARLRRDRLEDLQAQALRASALCQPGEGPFEGGEIVGEGGAAVAAGIPLATEDVGPPERCPYLAPQAQGQPPATRPVGVVHGDDREVEALRRADLRAQGREGIGGRILGHRRSPCRGAHGVIAGSVAGPTRYPS